MKLVAALLIAAVAAPASAQQTNPTPAPQARTALAEFARCVVRGSEKKVRATLTMDFTTPAYRNALQSLSENNRDCFGKRGRLRAGGLPFAAALAETLLERGQSPLNVRLLRASATEAPTYSVTDKLAMCVARSDPDNSARLVLAPIGSEAESAAVQALGAAVRLCTPAGSAAQLDRSALRSIVATASYRLLAAAGDVK